MTRKVLVTEKKIKEKLNEVLDPELGISIIDLGLVYEIKMQSGTPPHVSILMTLTTMGCPLFGVIEEDIFLKLADLNLSRSQIKIDMTFEPPWDIERMTKRGRAVLGI